MEEAGVRGDMITDKPVKVAAIQMVSSSDLDENMNTAAAWIQEAAQKEARLIVLPEYFCIMGHKDTDKLALRELPGAGVLQQFLAAQAREHGVWLVGGTIPLAIPDDDRIYNSCLVYGPDGNVQARYDKIHLFGFDNGEEVYSEADTIRAGDNSVQTFEGPCGPVGLSICYDLRFPEMYRAMGAVNLIVVPSAFTFTTGRAHWDILLRARAIENQCYVLAAAQGGRHDSGRRTWGHSVLIDPWGKVVDQLPEGEGLVMGEIDPARIARVRTALPALAHRIM